MLLAFLATLAAVTALGVFATERVDRPRRRRERLAAQGEAQ
ncbi:hypothetical protein PX554_14495 [Sphingomonas sp. H39-1-10]|nr:MULTISPECIES: hypothetical protein [Sphingomonas]MDF0489343.1 hypothetical protein [Sphingomonas pollutisoli]SDA29947.1 hypothetical protein SAMN03159340_02449 [Sphingomonas sp. NFR15]